LSRIKEIKKLFHDLRQKLLSGINAKKYEDRVSFEARIREKLSEDLRLNLLSFFYHTFESEMKEKQIPWHKEYNPLTIFCDREEKYRDLINKRLKLGFDFNNERTEKYL
jgi:hypothetical protein